MVADQREEGLAAWGPSTVVQVLRGSGSPPAPVSLRASAVVYSKEALQFCSSGLCVVWSSI